MHRTTTVHVSECVSIETIVVIKMSVPTMELLAKLSQVVMKSIGDCSYNLEICCT